MAGTSFENGMVGIDNLCQKGDRLCMALPPTPSEREGTKSPTPASPVSSVEEMGCETPESSMTMNNNNNNNNNNTTINNKKKPPPKSANML